MTFDRAELVEKIMHLFWEKGYNNISFNEIANETGISRASLYNSFKSKDDLFKETLDHYLSKSPDRVISQITPSDNIGKTLYAMLQEVSTHHTCHDKHKGCFAISCFDELAADQAHSPAGEYVVLQVGKRKAAFQQALQHAIDQGELSTSHTIDTTTNIFMTFISGLSVMAKGGATQRDIMDIVDGFFKQFGFKHYA